MSCNGLNIWAVSAQTTATMGGHGCLDSSSPSPARVYQSSSLSNRLATLSYHQRCDSGDNKLTNTTSSAVTELRYYTYNVDENGDIIISSHYYNSSSIHDHEMQRQATEYDIDIVGNIEIQDGEIISCNYTYTETNQPTEHISCKCDCGGGRSGSCTGCTGGCTNISVNVNDSGTRRIICEEGYDYDAPYLNFNQSRVSLAGELYLPFFNNLAKTSVEKKMNKKTDSDYELTGSFSFLSNNLDNPTAVTTTSQLITFKAGLPKEEMDEGIKRIEATVFFYIDGSNPSISPCCNGCGCFDGTILQQKDIILTLGSPVLNTDRVQFVASLNSADFQNYVGQTIKICAIRNKVEYF
jgi:hypothetical protein